MLEVSRGREKKMQYYIDTPDVVIDSKACYRAAYLDGNARHRRRFTP